MRFKTKDLMVSVVPNQQIDAEKLCLWGTRICIRPTLDPCRLGTWGCHPCSYLGTYCACTFQGTVGCGFFNSCGPDRSTCDPTIFCGGHSIWEIEDPADLVTLREELSEVMVELEKLEKAGLPAEFSTRAQAEEAEKALEGALAEIRRQKKGLK